LARFKMNETKPGRYRHYKGNEYEVLGTARHTETLEEMVVYRSLDEKRKMWVRPQSMFKEKVWVNGREINRFEYLPERE